MDHPVFGNLEDIFVIDNRVLFQLSVLETSNFNVHLQAHTVNHTQDREILLHKNLSSPFSMHIHRVTVDDSSFSVIICKYHICNVLYISYSTEIKLYGHERRGRDSHTVRGAAEYCMVYRDPPRVPLYPVQLDFRTLIDLLYSWAIQRHQAGA